MTKDMSKEDILEKKAWKFQMIEYDYFNNGMEMEKTR